MRGSSSTGCHEFENFWPGWPGGTGGSLNQLMRFSFLTGAFAAVARVPLAGTAGGREELALVIEPPDCFGALLSAPDWGLLNAFLFKPSFSIPGLDPGGGHLSLQC